MKRNTLLSLTILILIIIDGIVGYFVYVSFSEPIMKEKNKEAIVLPPTQSATQSGKVKYLSSSDQPKTGYAFYEDIEHGFRFEYPSNADFKGSGDYGAIDISRIHFRLLSKYNDPPASFEEGFKKDSRLWCMADGPVGSQYCLDDVRTEEYMNENNVKGIKLFRTWVLEKYGSNDRTRIERDDIIIGFPLSHQDEYGIFFSTDDADPINVKEMMSIANTFKYLEKAE